MLGPLNSLFNLIVTVSGISFLPKAPSAWPQVIFTGGDGTDGILTRIAYPPGSGRLSFFASLWFDVAVAAVDFQRSPLRKGVAGYN